MPGLNYSIFESIDESANGDDLEIIIKRPNGTYLTFAVQSKILYHNLPVGKKGVINLTDGHYHKMQHYVGRKKLNQIDLLLNYSKKNGCIPIYLLYNYVQRSTDVMEKCDVLFDERQYGCSIVSAHYLKKTYQKPDGNLPSTIKFSNLHPRPALPWFVLTCCFPNMSVEGILKYLGDIILDHPIIKEDSSNAINDDPQWKLLKETFDNSFREFNYSLFRLSTQFNPMYRIVLDTPNNTP